MQVIPYIIFNGNCEEALKFYEKALGGTIGQISRYGDIPGGDTHGQDPKWIMHSHFTANGNMLFMASDGPGNDKDSGMISLTLNFTDPGSIQNVFSKLSDSGTVTMPLQDTFWGATFGMLKDKYGIKWMLNYDKPKK
jgi:PhnB protein